jgi:hypothetical protein
MPESYQGGERIVAINAEQAGTPGWWMKRLFNMLGSRERQVRLARLHAYRDGKPPLPSGAEAVRETYEAFVKKSRTNFAELVVAALSERIVPVGFRTGQDNDETGDELVGQLWERAGMDTEAADLQDFVLTYGEAYVIVGDMDPETGAPVVTAEDPRWVVGDVDPANPRRLRAALKVIYDDTVNEDRAYLYMPGAVYVARRRRGYIDKVPHVTGEIRNPILFFSESAWDWDDERSGLLGHGRMPVVRFSNNQASVGEFENHTDLLDRINHQTLQCMVIGTMQAFRVRAVKGLPETDPRTGEEVDYSDIFRLDPGSIWQLPENAEMWESATTDLRPILEMIDKDLQKLASATRTPMHMLHPSGVNQSASGADLQREGLVFKADDRIKRWKHPYAQVASLMLTIAGDPARGDLSKLECIFASTERMSLTERADAASKAKASGLPTKTILVKIWGMSPDEAERTLSEIAAERLLAVQFANQFAAGPQPAGGTNPEQRQPAGPDQGQEPQQGQQRGNPPPPQPGGG